MFMDKNCPALPLKASPHGAADRDRKRWTDAGYQVTDTTCPLVKVAHAKLAQVVTEGL